MKVWRVDMLMQRVTLLALVALCRPTSCTQLRRLDTSTAVDPTGSDQLSPECSVACPGQVTLEVCFGANLKKCQAELASRFHLNSNTAEDKSAILKSFHGYSSDVPMPGNEIRGVASKETLAPNKGKLLRPRTANIKGAIPVGVISEASKMGPTHNITAESEKSSEADLSYGDHIRSIMDKTHKQTSEAAAEVASSKVVTSAPSSSGSSPGIGKTQDEAAEEYVSYAKELLGE